MSASTSSHHVTSLLKAPWRILRLQRIFILGVSDIDISRASRQLLPFEGWLCRYAMSIGDSWATARQLLPEIMMNMENSTAPWCMMASPGHRRYASKSSRPLALGSKQCLVRIPTHRYSRTHQLATAVPNSPHPGIKIRSTAESDSSRTNSWDLTCGSRWGP